MSNEFLDLLETFTAEEATVQRLFGSEGKGVRSMRKADPRYQRSLTEAASLYAQVLSGRKPMHLLQEAMSTSDFPLLFGDIIDRQLLGVYQNWPVTWSTFARKGTRRDFRNASLFTLDGAEGALAKVPQGSPYPEGKVNEGRYQYKVEKYGRQLPFLWEIFVNDDLDALRDMPNRLAIAARVTEERLATELFVDSTGPDATFYSVGNKNLAAVPADLTPDSLAIGLAAMWTQVDTDGNPIFTGKVRLVVPPQLTIKARNIVNASTIVTSPGATSGMQVVTENWAKGEVAEVVTNPWLPIIDTTNGDGAWYLFADPGIGRPALEVGFLRGHDSPELFMKSPNATRIGGGVVGAEDGDFDTDSTAYKVRHVVGGTLLDPKAAYANAGV
jgi:hypothetical protein